MTHKTLLSMNSKRLKLVTAVLLAATAVTILIHQRRNVGRLRADNADLQSRIAQLSESSEALRRSSPLLPPRSASSPARADGAPVELLQLRAEVARLRQPQSQQPEPPVFPFSDHSQPVTAEQIRKQVSDWNGRINDQIDSPRMADTGLQNASGKVDGHFLGSVEAVAERFKALEKLTPSELERLKKEDHVGLLQRYELLYRGSFKDIANPTTAVVFRERKATQDISGSWRRFYTFANGHPGLITSLDGDFSAFEAEHSVQMKEKPAGQ